MAALSYSKSYPTFGGHESGESVGALTQFWRRLTGWTAEKQLYHDTVAELSALTDRELEDIGINRYDIKRVAREAVAALPRA